MNPRPMRSTIEAQEFKLAPGDLGIAQTILTMQQLINDAAQHPAVRAAAVAIVRQSRVEARDHRGELEAVFNWAKRNIRFTDDPYGKEMLAHPLHTLETRGGDCDDYVVTMGGLLRSLGRQVRIVTIRADRREPGRQSHVFLQAKADGQWISLDPTVEGSSLGWTPQPLYGPPLIWGEMAEALPKGMRGLGRFVGLAQSSPTLPTPFPTPPPSSTQQAILQTVENIGAAAASRLAYGQQGGATAVTTGAAVQGSGYAGTALGAGLGISAGTLLIFGGIAFVVLMMGRKR